MRQVQCPPPISIMTNGHNTWWPQQLPFEDPWDGCRSAFQGQHWWRTRGRQPRCTSSSFYLFLLMFSAWYRQRGQWWQGQHWQRTTRTSRCASSSCYFIFADVLCSNEDDSDNSEENEGNAHRAHEDGSTGASPGLFILFFMLMTSAVSLPTARCIQPPPHSNRWWRY
jgi:hypothetical protein